MCNVYFTTMLYRYAHSTSYYKFKDKEIALYINIDTDKYIVKMVNSGITNDWNNVRETYSY